MVTFFLSLIASVNQKLSPEARQLVMSFYESLIAALISVIPNEKSSTVVINKISQALVHITNQI